jgi:hypothetical protein
VTRKLKCSIARDDGFGNLDYVVTDEHGIVVAMGTSSNADWVRYDAGGHHTKRKFDEMFPDGWEVDFDF